MFVNVVRPRLRRELHGLTYLIEVLDLTLRGAEEAQRQLNDQEVDLCCEVLKILFNVTVGMEATTLDEVARHRRVGIMLAVLLMLESRCRLCDVVSVIGELMKQESVGEMQQLMRLIALSPLMMMLQLIEPGPDDDSSTSHLFSSLSPLTTLPFKLLLPFCFFILYFLQSSYRMLNEDHYDMTVTLVSALSALPSQTDGH